MRFKGFIGPSYTLQSVDVDCQRSVNLYPEINEEGTGTEGEVVSLVSTPGLPLLCTLPTGPIRGNYTDSNGQLWAVGGNVLYQISSSWTYAAIGTLNTSTGPVSFSDNGSQVVVVDGSYGYYASISTSAPRNYFTVIQTDNGTNVGNGDFETGTTAGWTLVNSALSGTVPTATATAGVPFSVTSTGGTKANAASANLSFTASDVSPIAGNFSGLLSSSAASTVGDMLLSAAFNIDDEDQSSSLNIGFSYDVGSGKTPNMSGTSLNSFAVMIYDVTNAAWITPTGVYTMDTASGVGSAIVSFPTTENSTAYQLAIINVNSISGAYNIQFDSFDAGPISTAFAQITDPNFFGASQVTFMDGYFIFSRPGTDEFFLSPINSITPFNGLDIAAAEAAPENLQGLVAMQENVYLFSKRHFEIWYDSGNNDFPFTRVQGAVSQIGCAAAFSIATIQNTVYWLAQDNNGKTSVYCAQGLTPQRVSTYAIEKVLESLGDLSTARAWTYEQAGHPFYCLNLPGASTTWVFDASTNMWHERAHLAGGLYSRHLADCHAFAYNTNVVGDYSNGNIYSLDQTVFTDNGNAVVRERTTPHIAKDMNRIFHSALTLDIERGVGLTGSGQGTKPQAMLQWSNDGGHSWSNEHWVSIGAIGSYGMRAIWRRLGQSRSRVYRVRISDPVKVTLIGADLEIEEGAA